MRLQTFHPPFALISQSAPCLMSPFILARSVGRAEHAGDRHGGGVQELQRHVQRDATLAFLPLPSVAVRALCWLPTPSGGLSSLIGGGGAHIVDAAKTTPQ
jgi:hypothetical protein